MQDDEVNFDAITEAANAAEAEFQQSALKSRLAAIEERFAAIEALQEDANKRGLADAELASYISDLKFELKDLRRLRSVYGGFSILLTAFLLFTLLSLLFFPESPFYRLDKYPAVAVIITLVTGAVVLMITLAKGVHRSSTDRAKEDTTIDMPQLLTELTKRVKGG